MVGIAMASNACALRCLEVGRLSLRLRGRVAACALNRCVGSRQREACAAVLRRSESRRGEPVRCVAIEARARKRAFLKGSAVRVAVALLAGGGISAGIAFGELWLRVARRVASLAGEGAVGRLERKAASAVESARRLGERCGEAAVVGLVALCAARFRRGGAMRCSSGEKVLCVGR